MGRMSLRAFKIRSENDEPNVNLTPLIDVVFVILIMFILIAPLLEIDNVELAEAPKDSSQVSLATQEESSISIHVDKKGKITFNKTHLTLSQLKLKLAESKKIYPTAKVQLFYDKRGAFGTYQQIKNAAQEAGYEELALMLTPSG